MSRFTILLGGDLTPTPRLAAQVTGTRVIAADAGIRHAQMLGLVPELWVGDFDSVPSRLEGGLSNVERRTFPKEKDQTDGELAVTEALSRGATSLLIAGAFGGPRFDHSFLHVTLAIRLAEQGIDVMLTSGAQEGTPLSPAMQSFDYDDATVFSVLGLTQLDGLSVEGARWPLKAVQVPFGSSWTVSNEVRGALRASLSKGRAMLLAHPYPAEGF
ncbi:MULTISPECIES: thiamine diphosphokinase [Mesorhizobium]|uniref:Thiamine diphosphokinase n=1 Tax=Mesorhizobium denitrificans TaxID=2294114 RepID=A0A371XFI4_9HYPH|nr:MULTISPECIES: thiamine diphosphokinase [Mesorhizobium]RFC67981.1 thiamine diphosphokinase [Mesorhizobium denitrificans]